MLDFYVLNAIFSDFKMYSCNKTHTLKNTGQSSWERAVKYTKMIFGTT